MTIQTKHFIELTDIVSLRFTCKCCGVTMSLPISDNKLIQDNLTNQFLTKCPSCHYEWAEQKYEALITSATASLHKLCDLFYGPSAPKLEFSLLVEVKPEAVLDSCK